MTINKQALREMAERAASDSWGYDRDEFNDAITPEVVLALLDELEGKEKQRAAANKVVVQQDIEIQELRLRIAELEARTVKLPEYRNSPDMHTKQFYEAIGFNEGLDAFISALRAAGVAVEGE